VISSAGTPVFTYMNYPQVIIAGPPLAPTLTSPFADEHEPEPDTVFEFFATDMSGDDLDFQIQVAESPSFSTNTVDRTSQWNPLEFLNLTNTSDKRPFNAGDLMQFTSPTTLTASST
jgi:hypothetical protein